MNNVANWKDKLPANWTTLPLKAVATYSVSSVDKLTNEEEIPVELCNYVDVYKNDFIDQSLLFMKASASKEEINKYSVQAGDVLITKDSESWDDIGIPALVTFTREKLLCGYHLAIIRPNRKTVNPEFLFRSLQSKEIRIQLELASTGVTRFGLPKHEIGKLLLAVPNIETQNKIVKLLKKEFQKINSLILAKEKLIKILESKRQALVASAITKGVNPNAKMKISGIDWIGEVPANWDISKVKYLSNKIGSGVTPKGGAEVYQSEGIPILRSQNIHFDGLKLEDVAFISSEIHKSMSNSRVQNGDVLLNITGASIGRCFYFEGQFDEANVNQHVCIIRPNDKILTKYLYLFLSSDIGQMQIAFSQVGGGREGLNLESLKDFLVPLPSLKEQQEIVNIVEKEKRQIVELEQKTYSTISLLKEKKESLISSAVTGQIEITE